MPKPISTACVIGNGAMGTLCALVLSKRGTQVTLWGRTPEHVQQLAKDRENKRYLPGHRFEDSIRHVSDPADAFCQQDLIISAVPCQFVRKVWTRLAPHVPRNIPIVSTTKGIEIDSLKLPTDILVECLGDVPTCCLSGPNIAPEIAEEKPASAVAASKDLEVAKLVQHAFSTASFRVYTSTDLVGVEVAGAAKNVIAIAAGISDGLGAGDNAKAALVTRGLVEITRLGVALGASSETFRGLAGIGDLVTTCVSRIGRNRSAGERIGRGQTADQVMATTDSIIEGIPTTRSLLELAARVHVEMPIVEGVASVLFEGCDPLDAIRALMTRPLHSEHG